MRKGPKRPDGIPMALMEVPIEKLSEHPDNPRKISAEKLADLKRSIQSIPEMLYKRPLVVVTHGEGYRVLGGNQRLRALRELGYEAVPVMLADELTEEQQREFIVKDNVGFGEWDWDALANQWDADALVGWGMELPVDFSNPSGEGLTDPEEIPEAPANPVSRLGDVWVMGNHRLVCGDSTSPDVVAKCLNGVKPHLMVTDPPYGVNYDPTWRTKAGVNGGTAAHGLVRNDDRADWRRAWALFPGEVAYVWHSGVHSAVVAESLQAAGFDIRSQIIWNKGRLVIGRSDYHWQHEPCWYAVRKGGKGHWIGGRKQTTVWDIDKPAKSETGHSTQKPVECMKRPMENNSKPGDAVYEPFSGSGTTIIAGEMTGRSVHAIELAPEYVDVAVKRWQDFTGQKAIHEATGKTFDELALINVEAT